MFTPSALIVLFFGLAMMLNDTGELPGVGQLLGHVRHPRLHRDVRDRLRRARPGRQADEGIVASGGANTPEAHAEMNRIFLVARADAAILMLVVVDMVAKPFL